LCLCSSRTVADTGERWPALLESVLRATPQEFESPILRHPDLRRCAWISLTRCAASQACVSFPVSVKPWPYVLFRTNRRGGPLRRLTLYLVRDVADVSERNGARRSVHPSVQCRPGRPCFPDERMGACAPVPPARRCTPVTARGKAQPADGAAAGSLQGEAEQAIAGGTLRFLADPHCVKCGPLAHVPVSSRVPPAVDGPGVVDDPRWMNRPSLSAPVHSPTTSHKILRIGTAWPWAAIGGRSKGQRIPGRKRHPEPCSRERRRGPYCHRGSRAA